MRCGDAVNIPKAVNKAALGMFLRLKCRTDAEIRKSGENPMDFPRFFAFFSIIPLKALVNLDNCFLVIRAARFADLVRNHQLAAFAAFHKAGCCDLPALRFSFISFGF